MNIVSLEIKSHQNAKQTSLPINRNLNRNVRKLKYQEYSNTSGLLDHSLQKYSNISEVEMRITKMKLVKIVISLLVVKL